MFRIENLTTILLLSLTIVTEAKAQEIPRLTIGTIFPMSGMQRAYGKEAIRGIKLARDHFLEIDREYGQKIHVVIKDDKAKAKVAGAVAAELLKKERAHVIIGSINAATSLAIADHAKARGRPLVTPISTTGSFADNEYVFRSCFDNLSQGELLAEFATQSLMKKRAAVLRDDTETSKKLARRFVDRYRNNNGQVVAQIVYELGTTEFKEFLQIARKKMAEVILVPAHHATAAEIMKQARELDYRVQLLGGDNWDSPALTRSAGIAGAGHYFASHFADDSIDPKVKRFVAEFSRIHGRKPGAIAALAYDAFMVVADAFRRARTTLRKPFLRAFQRTRNFQGITGVISFSNTGLSAKSVIIKETYATGSRFKVEISPTRKF